MLTGKPPSSHHFIKAFIAGFIIVAGFSCKTPVFVKNYQPNKPFVYATNINLKGNFSKADKDELTSRLKSQLDDSLRVRSLSKVLWSVMKHPPVYDSSNADKSIIFMRALLNSLGYFRDSITYDTTLKIVDKDEYRTTINFNVTPGKQVTLDSIGYNLQQSDLQILTLANLKATYLKKGDPFAKSAISIELDRLTELYRNNGYFRFGREELIGLWDTLDVAFLQPTMDPFEELAILKRLQRRRDTPTANLEIRLKPNYDSSKMVKYFVGNITVYPDYIQDTMTYKLDTVHYTRHEVYESGVKVVYFRKIFKPHIFPEDIFLRRGDLYSQSKYIKTINRFDALGSWRVTNIKSDPRKDQDTVDFTLLLTPEKKYSFTTTLEGSRNQSAVSGNLFGLAINVAVQNRNFARAANQAVTNVRYGIEFGSNKGENFIQTQQVVLSHNIYFPRPIPNSKWIPPVVRDNFRTSLSFNLANTDRRDLYNLVTVNGSWGYEFNLKKANFTLRIPNIEYSNLNSRPQLDALIANNPSLKSIFTDGFISSVIAGMSISGGHHNNLNVFRTNLEVPELVTTLLHNRFLDTNLYKFVKIDGEFTRKIQYKKTAIALRFFGGVGYEFNSTVNPLKQNSLPFFKQYFSGGPNSMRAWGLRKLGPGSSIKEFTGANGIPERYGDIQLEANAEYRFPLATVAGTKINGALFTDVGNVWLLKKNAGTPEEIFKFSKLAKDLAVGAGAGLRVDFSFLVIRFDYSYKVKDPSPSPDFAFLQNKWFGYRGKNFLKGTQFQLGISYPFIL